MANNLLLFLVASVLVEPCIQAQDKPDVFPKDADPWMDEKTIATISRFLSKDWDAARVAIDRMRYSTHYGHLADRQIKSTRATRNLLRIIKSQRPDEIRALAASHVGYFCPKAKSLQQIVRRTLVWTALAKEETPRVRDACALGLRYVKDDIPEVTQALLVGTRSKDPSVAAYACQILATRKALRSDIIAALTRIAQDKRLYTVGISNHLYGESPIAIEAIDALAAHGRAAAAALPVLNRLTGRQESNISIQAARAIILIARPGSATQGRAEVQLRIALRKLRLELAGDSDSIRSNRGWSMLEGLTAVQNPNAKTTAEVEALLKLDGSYTNLISAAVLYLGRHGQLRKKHLPALKRHHATAASVFYHESEARRIAAGIRAIETGKPFVDPPGEEQ